MDIQPILPCKECLAYAEHIHIFYGEEIIRCSQQCEESQSVSARTLQTAVELWNEKQMG